MTADFNNTISVNTQYNGAGLQAANQAILQQVGAVNQLIGVLLAQNQAATQAQGAQNRLRASVSGVTGVMAALVRSVGAAGAAFATAAGSASRFASTLAGAVTGAVNRSIAALGRLKATAQSMGGVLRTGFTAFGLAGAAFLGNATRAIADFEDRLRVINTIARAAAEDLRSGIGEGLRDAAVRSGNALNDLAGSYYELLSVGFQASSAQGVLNNALNLSIGGLGTTTEAVQVLSFALNGFNLNISDAQENYQALILESAKAANVFHEGADGVRDYANTVEEAALIVSNQFAKAVELGAVTTSQISSTLATVAPNAAAAGVGIDEIAATYATLTARGVTAARAMTQMNRAIIEFTKTPARPMREALAELGLTVEDVAQTIRDEGLVEAMQLLRDRASAAGIDIAKVFGRDEARRFFNNVTSATRSGVNAFTDYQEALRLIRTDVNVAARQAEERGDTVARNWQRVRNVFRSLSIEVGYALLRPLNTLLKTVIEVIRSIEDWARANRALVEALAPLASVVSLMFALTAGTQGLLLVLVPLAGVFGVTGTQLRAFVLPLQILMGLLGTVTLAVGSFRYAVENSVRGFGEFREELTAMQTLAAETIDLFQTIGASVLYVWRTIGEGGDAGQAVQTSIDLIGQAFEDLLPALEEVGRFVVQVGVTIGAMLVEGLQRAIPAIAGWAASVAETILPLLASLAVSLIQWAQEVVPQIIDGLGDLGREIIDWLQGVIPNVLTIGRQLTFAFVGWLQDVVPIVLDGLANLFSEITTAVSQATPQMQLAIAAGVLGWFAGLPIRLIALAAVVGPPLLEAFVAWIPDAAPAIAAGLVDILTQIITWVGDAVRTIAAAALPLARALAQWVNDAAPHVLAALGTLLAQIVGWVQSAVPVILSAVGAWAGAIVEWFATDGATAIREGLTTIVTAIGDFLRGSQVIRTIGTAVVEWASAIIQGLGFVIGQVVGWLAGNVDKILAVFLEVGTQIVVVMAEAAARALPTLVGAALALVAGFIRAIVEAIVNDPASIARALYSLLVAAPVLVAVAAAAVFAHTAYSAAFVATGAIKAAAVRYWNLWAMHGGILAIITGTKLVTAFQTAFFLAGITPKLIAMLWREWTMKMVPGAAASGAATGTVWQRAFAIATTTGAAILNMFVVIGQRLIPQAAAAGGLAGRAFAAAVGGAAALGIVGALFVAWKVAGEAQARQFDQWGQQLVTQARSWARQATDAQLEETQRGLEEQLRLVQAGQGKLPLIIAGQRVADIDPFGVEDKVKAALAEIQAVRESRALQAEMQLDLDVNMPDLDTLIGEMDLPDIGRELGVEQIDLDKLLRIQETEQSLEELRVTYETKYNEIVDTIMGGQAGIELALKGIAEGEFESDAQKIQGLRDLRTEAQKLLAEAREAGDTSAQLAIMREIENIDNNIAALQQAAGILEQEARKNAGKDVASEILTAAEIDNQQRFDNLLQLREQQKKLLAEAIGEGDQSAQIEALSALESIQSNIVTLGAAGDGLTSAQEALARATAKSPQTASQMLNEAREQLERDKADLREAAEARTDELRRLARVGENEAAAKLFSQPLKPLPEPIPISPDRLDALTRPYTNIKATVDETFDAVARINEILGLGPPVPPETSGRGAGGAWEDLVPKNITEVTQGLVDDVLAIIDAGIGPAALAAADLGGAIPTNIATQMAENRAPVQAESNALGADIPAGLSQGITGAQDQPVTAMNTVISTVLGTVQGVSLYASGQMFVQSFVNGMKSVFDIVAQVSGLFAETAASNVRFQSPPKVGVLRDTETWGRRFVELWTAGAVGAASTAAQAGEAIASVLDGVLSALSLEPPEIAPAEVTDQGGALASFASAQSEAAAAAVAAIADMEAAAIEAGSAIEGVPPITLFGEDSEDVLARVRGQAAAAGDALADAISSVAAAGDLEEGGATVLGRWVDGLRSRAASAGEAIASVIGNVRASFDDVSPQAPDWLANAFSSAIPMVEALQSVIAGATGTTNELADAAAEVNAAIERSMRFDTQEHRGADIMSLQAAQAANAVDERNMRFNAIEHRGAEMAAEAAAAFANAFASGADAAGAAADGLMAPVEARAAALRGNVAASGLASVQAWLDALAAGGAAAPAAVTPMLTAVTTILGSIPNLFTSGANIVATWIEGMLSMVPAVADAVNQVVTPARNRMVATSPPKEGPLAVPGIGGGGIVKTWAAAIEAAIPTATDAVNLLTGAVANSLQQSGDFAFAAATATDGTAFGGGSRTITPFGLGSGRSSLMEDVSDRDARMRQTELLGEIAAATKLSTEAQARLASTDPMAGGALSARGTISALRHLQRGKRG